MSIHNDSDEFVERLRKLIKDIRIDSRKTQVEFVKSVKGLQKSSIARMESGASENMGIKTLYEIALACEMPLSELMKRAEGKSRIADDPWDKVEKQIHLLSGPKRKWLAKIVKDILSSPTDN